VEAQELAMNGKAMLGVVWTVGLLATLGCQSKPTAASATDKPSYAFWPPFPDDPRIQFVASFASSEDVAPVRTSGLERIVFGKESEGAAIIQKPYGVAAHAGKIYIADMRGKALVVLDLKNKQMRLVGVSGVNTLEHPVAVAVADDGMIYVADNSRGTVFVYSAAERYSQVFGFPKFKPVALAIHQDRLYAVDLAGQNVVMFDRMTGKKLGTFGAVGDEDGQFRVPLGVATDRAGNVYVMDMMRCRLQKFTRDGQFISGTGSLGDHVGSFARPKHIAVDKDGLIYIVDAAFQNVQMFDPEYRMLMHFGSVGDFPGSMNLPAGVAVSEEGLELFRDRLHPGFDAKRLVFVSNQFGPTKVVVYAMGERKTGYSAQDLAAAALKVPSGTGLPSEEQLRMQNPGGEEPPGAGGGPAQQPKDEPVQPSKPEPTVPPQPR
jgi:DNA-binding beta-propeller fold protein YncE